MALDNKALVRRYMEGVFGKQHNLALIDEILSDNYVEYQDYDSSGERVVRGREEWKKVVDMYFSAFTDVQCTIEELIAEEDKIACRWKTRARHKGTFLGLAPTNKRIIVTGITIFRIDQGKIVEGRTNWDMMGLVMQLGALPAQLEKAA